MAPVPAQMEPSRCCVAQFVAATGHLRLINLAGGVSGLAPIASHATHRDNSGAERVSRAAKRRGGRNLWSHLGNPPDVRRPRATMMAARIIAPDGFSTSWFESRPIVNGRHFRRYRLSRECDLKCKSEGAIPGRIAISRQAKTAPPDQLRSTSQNQPAARRLAHSLLASARVSASTRTRAAPMSPMTPRMTRCGSRSARIGAYLRCRSR